MMSSAADALKVALEKSEISEPSDVKTIANINAEYYKTSEEIAEGLIKQLTSAIYWQKCMEKFIAQGIENFYEIGPGRVLTGLMRRINRKIKVVNVSSLQVVNKLLNP
jgi:[acyl-carrier-protein] S-malonyltransferase